MVVGSVTVDALPPARRPVTVPCAWVPARVWLTHIRSRRDRGAPERREQWRSEGWGVGVGWDLAFRPWTLLLSSVKYFVQRFAFLNCLAWCAEAFLSADIAIARTVRNTRVLVFKMGGRVERVAVRTVRVLECKKQRGPEG